MFEREKLLSFFPLSCYHLLSPHLQPLKQVCNIVCNIPNICSPRHIQLTFLYPDKIPYKIWAVFSFLAGPLTGVMCNHLVPLSCLCSCTPRQLFLFCCIILRPLHLCCVHKPKSIPSIWSTIVHLIHFTNHSPSFSYLPYLVILMLYCHLALLSRQIKKHDFA